MYILGDVARTLVNLAFGLIGVGMAHAFYRSTRKRSQVITAWVLGFLYCTVMAELVALVDILPQSSHEHTSNVVGIGALFVYLYLFTGVPVAQRIFTYFFIDNCIYILVILSRLISLAAERWLPGYADALFMAVFALLAAVFLRLFSKRLKKAILRGLGAFRNQLPILTVYACVTYIVMLVFLDPWGPMPLPGLGEAFKQILFCSAAVCGYVLVFYVLYATRKAQDEEVKAGLLRSQLNMSKQYYDSLVKSIERDRALRHDFTHHLCALEGMWAQGETEKLGQYLEGLIERGNSSAPARYCACYSANILLDYFARQCRDANIAFSCDAVIPELSGKEGPQLCVVLGNLLQNALDACLRVPPEGERFVSLLARVVNGSVTIDVANRFDGVVRREDGRICTLKDGEGHGLGLASVADVAESGGGFFDISWEETVFHARAVLKLPIPDADACDV